LAAFQGCLEPIRSTPASGPGVAGLVLELDLAAGGTAAGTHRFLARPVGHLPALRTDSPAAARDAAPAAWFGCETEILGRQVIVGNGFLDARNDGRRFLLAKGVRFAFERLDFPFDPC